MYKIKTIVKTEDFERNRVSAFDDKINSNHTEGNHFDKNKFVLSNL